MNILHLSSSDVKGGAAIATFRLHQGLRKIGLNSQMHVGKKLTDDHSVRTGRTKLEKGYALLTPVLDKIPLQLYANSNRNAYSTEIVTNLFDPAVVRALDADIVNLHWICHGYLRIDKVAQIDKPVVWTLHDMWPFTGGCHYSENCTRYTANCGLCPQLKSKYHPDLSYYIWKRKQRSWKRKNMTVVTPSRWLRDCAASSSLFRDSRIEIIPNGIDVARFKPISKQLCRDLLSLPDDKKLVLFGAESAVSDARKGFQYLREMLAIMNRHIKPDDLELVVFGASSPAEPLETGFKCRYLGHLHDEISLAVLYSACDVFIAPSIQDNLPNTVMESLACGTPCVAFHVGGMPDMIEHRVNGYLAKPFDAGDLANGVTWTLENTDRWSQLSRNARQTVVSRFAVEDIANRYAALYRDLSV